jgi:hypothetical protein
MPRHSQASSISCEIPACCMRSAGLESLKHRQPLSQNHLYTRHGDLARACADTECFTTHSRACLVCLFTTMSGAGCRMKRGLRLFRKHFIQNVLLASTVFYSGEAPKILRDHQNWATREPLEASKSTRKYQGAVQRWCLNAIDNSRRYGGMTYTEMPLFIIDNQLRDSGPRFALKK